MTMNADKLTRVTAVLAAVAVTAVAAMISYEHTVDVVTRHGAAGLTGHLYSVVIDGPIVVASMVIADSARRRIPAGALAWMMLAAGIVATITVNLLSGTEYGILGSIIAAWPAAAFAGTYELLMTLVRRTARREADPDKSRADLAVVPVETGTGEGRSLPVPEPLKPAVQDLQELLGRARLLDAEHRMAKDGKPISRENLRRGLRTSTERADRIIKIIRAEARQGAEVARETVPEPSLEGLAPAA
ncbi:MAG: hypothetical protein JWN00_6008 [Actinomycetia bacterium]|nr:hypothetical protein [Actinomycetes bacterium]